MWRRSSTPDRRRLLEFLELAAPARGRRARRLPDHPAPQPGRGNRLAAFEGIPSWPHGRRLGPEVLVEEIIDAFAARYDVTVDTVSTVVEDMVFPLPRELRSEAAE